MFTGQDFAGYTAVVTGWGRKIYKQIYRDRFLKQVKLRVLSNKECAETNMESMYSPYSYQMICAYGHGIDACKVNLT